MGPEKKIQNEIMDWLRVQAFVSKVVQIDRVGIRGRKLTNRFRPAGIPDVLFVLRGGRVGFVEVKASRAAIEKALKDNTAQAEFIASEQINGSFAMFACSLWEVIRALANEGYRC